MLYSRGIGWVERGEIEEVQVRAGMLGEERAGNECRRRVTSRGGAEAGRSRGNERAAEID